MSSETMTFYIGLNELFSYLWLALFCPLVAIATLRYLKRVKPDTGPSVAIPRPSF